METPSNNFIKLIHYPDLNAVECLWLEDTKIMTDKQYREYVLEFAEFIKKKRPKNVIVNTKKFDFIINVTTQTWLIENLYPVYAELQIEKHAIICSTDFVAEISIEQVLEEEVTHPFENAYFEDLEKAKEWIAKT